MVADRAGEAGSLSASRSSVVRAGCNMQQIRVLTCPLQSASGKDWPERESANSLKRRTNPEIYR